jgi:hypothetical protein
MLIETTPSRAQGWRAAIWRRLKRLLIVAAIVVVAGWLYAASFSPERENWDGQRAELANRAVQSLPVQPDRDALLSDVRELASEIYAGRRVDSDGGRLAADYLVGRLQALGIAPLVPGYRQPFSFQRKRIRQFWTGGIDTHGVNLLGVVRGQSRPDDYLVVSAHYDHLGEHNGAIYPGADDNASGVATLLAAAAHFKAHPPAHSIVFALFDGEETGMAGARHFVDSGVLSMAKVRLNLNFDMLSRSSDGVLFATGTWQHPELKALVDPLRAQAPIVVLYGHDQPRPFWDSEDWVHASDHGCFHDAGVPFLYLGVPDHADYHRPGDTFDAIDADFFVDCAAFALSLVAAADAAE